MKSTEEIEASLADLASLRHKTYLVLSALFQYPDDERLDQLAAFLQEMQKDDELARNFPYFSSFDKLHGRVESLSDEERSNLQTGYIDLFQVGRPKAPCPLYESATLDTDGHMAGWIISQVEQSYVAAGFSLTDNAKGELPDHASLELEYMSVLCARETEARDNDSLEKASDSLRLQRMFLRQHLLRWFPRLTHKLRLLTASESIYHELAEAANAFIVHDGDFVEVLAGDGVFSVEEGNTAQR